MTTDLCHPHGVMECWSTGLVGSKSRKNRIPIPLLLLVQGKFTHHSSTPLLQYSIRAVGPTGRSPTGARPLSSKTGSCEQDFYYILRKKLKRQRWKRQL